MENTPPPDSNRPLIIVVAHGSRSKRWVAAVRQWFEETVAGVYKTPFDADLELTFLEITDPPFEEVLEREKGPGREILIFPFFLSKSGHAGDEIPEIAEGILGSEQPWRIITMSSWEEVLGRNAERRLIRYGSVPGEPVVVSGYGASSHGEVWEDLARKIRANAGRFSVKPDWIFVPSGHFLDAPNALLDKTINSLVEQGHTEVSILPIYLSISTYQEILIPSVLENFPTLTVHFQPDAILPDSEIVAWSIKMMRQCLIEQGEGAS